MSENVRVERDIADVLADVGGPGWWWIGYGAFSVAAGQVALTWPAVTVVVLAVMFGVQLLVLGTFRVASTLAKPDSSAAAKALSVVVVSLAFVCGFVCLWSPEQTVAVLTLVSGAFWLILAVAEVVHGLSVRDEPERVWTVLGGLIGVIGGILLLSSLQVSAVALAWLLGVFLLLESILTIVAASWGRRRVPPPPTARTAPVASDGNGGRLLAS